MCSSYRCSTATEESQCLGFGVPREMELAILVHANMLFLSPGSWVLFPSWSGLVQFFQSPSSLGFLSFPEVFPWTRHRCSYYPPLSQPSLGSLIFWLLKEFLFVWFNVLWVFFFFWTGSYYIALTGLKLGILLPQSLECWNYKCAITTSFKGYFWISTSKSHLNNRFYDKIHTKKKKKPQLQLYCILNNRFILRKLHIILFLCYI